MKETSTDSDIRLTINLVILCVELWREVAILTLTAAILPKSRIVKVVCNVSASLVRVNQWDQ